MLPLVRCLKDQSLINRKFNLVPFLFFILLDQELRFKKSRFMNPHIIFYTTTTINMALALKKKSHYWVLEHYKFFTRLEKSMAHGVLLIT